MTKIPEIRKEKIGKFDYIKKIFFNLASKNTVKKLTAWAKTFTKYNTDIEIISLINKELLQYVYVCVYIYILKEL